MSKRIIERQRQRGQSIIEFALTLPLLVTIFAGLVHFGIAMRSQQMITNASRVGARRATQAGGNTSNVQDAVMSYCQEAGLTTSHITVQTNINTGASKATVTVSYQFNSPVQTLLTAMLRMLGNGSEGQQTLNQLQATTVMRL